MYEQREIFVPRKHHAEYRDTCDRGTTRIRNIHGVVYSFKISTAYYIIYFDNKHRYVILSATNYSGI